MSIWVLDDGPFGALARIFDPTWQWPPATLHLVREVASGAKFDKSGRRQKLLAMTSGGSLCFAVHDILEGTPAASMLFEYLRLSSTNATRDLGGDASIAFCAMEWTDAIFVTQDKGAALVALAELGMGRVATPFDLWHELAGRGLISRDQFQLLCESTRKSDSAWPGVPARFGKSS